MHVHKDRYIQLGSHIRLHICTHTTCIHSQQNPASVGAFEAALIPPFQQMLGMETCQEFGGYVFQILAQLLELRSDVSEMYCSIFPSLLHPKLWENHGSVPAITRLLRAYLAKDARSVTEGKHLVGLLGIFQKLNSSKKLDHHGFALLMAIFQNTPMATLGPYIGEMLKLIFSRLQPERRTTKYTKSLVVFLSFFVNQYGMEALLQAMNGIQPGIFCMILEKVWPSGIDAVSDDMDKKVCVVGITRMLFQSPEMITPPYSQFW
jgi:exportin-2 (importin alpha re-exporter)